MSYMKVKQIAIELVDDFTDLKIVSGYGSTYTAKTKLDSIEVTAPVRSVMPPRTNKVCFKEFGSTWKGVRPVDTVKCKTIGEYISLLAKKMGQPFLMGNRHEYQNLLGTINSYVSCSVCTS